MSAKMAMGLLWSVCSFTYESNILGCKRGFRWKICFQNAWYRSSMSDITLVYLIKKQILGVTFLSNCGLWFWNTSLHYYLQRNFVESMAGYSLVCYLLQVNVSPSLSALFGNVNINVLHLQIGGILFLFPIHFYSQLFFTMY